MGNLIRQAGTAALLAAAIAVGGTGVAAQDPGARAQFLGIDRNLDDVIDAIEAADFRRRLFATLDLDKDGAITPAEWIEATKAASPVSPERPVETPDALKQADGDGNGRVNLAELLAVGRDKFAALDLNGDGQIDRTEFKRDGL